MRLPLTLNLPGAAFHAAVRGVLGCWQVVLSAVEMRKFVLCLLCLQVYLHYQACLQNGLGGRGDNCRCHNVYQPTRLPLQSKFTGRTHSQSKN